MTKIRIKKLPQARKGLFANMPFAGALPISPFGLIQSDVNNLPSTYNGTVKPIDREKANIEAEKGEILFKFNAGGIFKIAGKRHSQGGTPIKAESGDFIFSDDKGMAINKKEAEAFNLKYSERGKKNNTPAKVLAKEIDIKKYNKFINILNDPNSDIIAKTTAQLMLAKYMEKVGQVGYLQESKKSFPQGIPAFAQTSAPVYSKDVKDAQENAEMYKKGGTVLPKAQMGFLSGLRSGLQRFNTGTNNTTSNNTPGYPQNVFDPRWLEVLAGNSRAILSPEATANINIKIPGTQHKNAQGMYDGVTTPEQKQNLMNRQWWYFKDKPNFNFSDPNQVRDFQTQYNTRANDMFGFNYFGGSSFRAVDGKLGQYTYNAPSLEERQRTTNIPERQRSIPTDFHTNINIPTPNPNANKVSNVPTVPFQGYNIGMNAMEVLSGITPYLSALAMPTYYDMLTQKYSPNIRLDRINNTNETNQLQQQSALAQREAFANMSGQTAALATADTRASEAANLMRSNAMMNQGNTQIANQESMINYQQDQQDNMFNLQNVHQTYNNNILAKQRRDNQLMNGTIDSMGNFMAIQNNLDTMNQAATAAALPFLSEVDAMDENGNPIKVQVPPIGFNRNRIPVPTGFGSFDSMGVQALANTPDSGDYKAAYEYFLNKGVTPDKAAQAATIIFYGRSGQKNAGTYGASNPYAAMMSGLYHF